MTVKDHEIPYYQQRYKVALKQWERVQRIQKKGEFKYKYKSRVWAIASRAYTFFIEMELVKDENHGYINAENYNPLESIESRFNTSVTL